MEDEPPEMELNDYIVEYKQTSDDYWLNCFLHRFEKTKLNGWVYKLCDDYSQYSRYKDFKQEMISVLFEKLFDYDSTVGTTLLQYANHDIKNAIHDYMRKNAGVFLLSDRYYRNLRKVNAIYYRDSDLTQDVRIQIAMSETGLSLKKVIGYIDDGKWFRYPESIGSSISDFELGKRTLDIHSSPEHIVLHDMFMATLLEAIENLRERDRQLLFDYLGIVDFSHGLVIDESKIRLADIADKHQLRDEQSVTNRFNRIIDDIRAELEK